MMPLHNDIDMLSDPIRTKAKDALIEMQSDPELKKLGVDRIQVIETLRDLAVQMAYYSRGLMPVKNVKEMYAAAKLWNIGDAEATKPVTWILDSKHLRGQAVDIAPVKAGHVWWAAPHEVWERIGVIGEKHGLKWGGRWKNKDGPHFEI